MALSLLRHLGAPPELVVVDQEGGRSSQQAAGNFSFFRQGLRPHFARAVNEFSQDGADALGLGSKLGVEAAPVEFLPPVAELGHKRGSALDVIEILDLDPLPSTRCRLCRLLDLSPGRPERRLENGPIGPRWGLRAD